MTIFAVPYAVFPAMAGYGLGIIDSPGILLYLIVTVITLTSTTIFAILEIRYFILFGENSWWRHIRKPIIAGSYIMVFIYFIPAQFFIPEQETARKMVWDSLGCQPAIPPNRQLFVLSTDLVIPAYSILIAELIPSMEIGSAMFMNNYKLLVARTSKLSRKTLNLQWKLSIALTIQVNQLSGNKNPIFYFQSNFDISLFFLPVNAVVLMIKYSYHDQTINNLVFIVLSIHGSASTIIMLLIHKPYRDYIFSPFYRFFQRSTTFAVNMNTA
uniref:G_PROTEIN_RECEP_F1_2 domain-containing protein n=1 Tax=Caenorhabditis tropicalis TaxID=1561998 RepID=A0A1I7TXS6_9PELO